MVRDRLLDRLRTPDLREVVRALEDEVRRGELTPDQAATRIVDAVDGKA